VGSGWEGDADWLTPAECRELADDLMAAADEAERWYAGIDRMTNFSRRRHRVPFNPDDPLARAARRMAANYTEIIQTPVNLTATLDFAAGTYRKTKARRS
jgi:hypothetical protein